MPIPSSRALLLFWLALHHLVAGLRNLVVVVVDDLGIQVSPYLDKSHPLSQIDFTPNIRRLSEEGVTFNRAYVQNAA